MNNKLYRSEKDRMVGGVCGGMGEYLNVDPVFIRIAFVLLALASGVGLLIYIILWIVIPTSSSPAVEPRQTMREGVAEVRERAKELGEEVREAFRSEEQGSKEPAAAPPSPPVPARDGSHRRAYIIGGFLILLGVIFLVDNLFPWFSLRRLWPLILIAGGVALLLEGRR